MFGNLKQKIDAEIARIKGLAGKRRGFSSLINSAFSILIVGFVIGMGALFTSAMKNSTTDTTARTIFDNVLSGFSTMGSQMNLLATVAVFVFLLWMVMGVAYRFGMVQYGGGNSGSE